MSIQGKSEKYFTTAEAADYLGFAEDTIRRYINRNLISAMKFGNSWAVAENELRRYREEKRNPGRQKNSK